MIERVAQPNETRLECAQIKCFERQRLQELLYLPGCIDRRIISHGFPEKPTAHSIDRTMRKFQDRTPRGLERDGPSRLREDWVEAADSRLGACAGHPLYEMRETIKPWIERENPNQLENAAECRQGQHSIGLVELSADQTSQRRDRSEKQDPNDADRNIVHDMRHCCASHRQPGADCHQCARRSGSDALADNHCAGLFKGQRPRMHGHECGRRRDTRTLHHNRHQDPDSSEDPLPAETASANGIEVPRNPLHSRLQVVDADEEQSESGQDRSARTRFALANNPEKGTDTEHRQSKSRYPQAKPEYRYQPWCRGRAESRANDYSNGLREGDQSGADEANDGKRRRG